MSETNESEPTLAAAERGHIQSIDRASQILEMFDQDTFTLSAAMVADRIGLNRTTAHRYLVSMQSTGLLDSSFGPGPLLEQLSTFISGRRRVLECAPPIMQQLAHDAGATVVLSLWGNSGAVVALTEDPRTGTILVTVRVGTVLSVRGAQTRVLLAFQSDQILVDRYLATLSEADRLYAEGNIPKVRRDHLAWSDLSSQGLATVAVPVFGTRDVHAAIALLSTSAMLSPATSAREVALLRDAAEKLSRELGG